MSSLTKAYFTGSHPVPEWLVDRAEWVHHTLKSRGLWLSCDCLPVGMPKPLLCPVMPMTLRRMEKGHPEHGPNCHFRRHYYDFAQIEPARERTTEDLTVHSKFGNGMRETGTSGGGGKAGSRLSTVLFRIVEDASLNMRQYGQAQPRQADIGPNLLSEVANMTLCGTDGTKILLGDMLVTGGPQWKTIDEVNQLKLRIAALTAEEWPSECRPQGYFIGIVDSFRYDEKRRRYLLNIPGWKTPMYVEARPRIFGEAATSGKRAPYLAIVSFARPDPSATKVLGLSCYLQPCIEDTWMPVDSDRERTTFRELEAAQTRWARWLSIDIEKPLFDDVFFGRNGREQRCRPDFVLWVRRDGRGDGEVRVAIETMGSADEVYRERKKRTHEIMKERYEGFEEHELSSSIAAERNIASADFSKKLDRTLREISLGRPPIRDVVTPNP